jgi:predicted ABC-type ATPase
MKQIVVLGGPNGAGKTTAAQIILPDKLGITEFVNADEIARGLSPFNPDAAALSAGRVMLERMHHLAQGERSFAFETTCSGKGHIGFLRRCKALGWRITLVFLWLPSPEFAMARVARRTAAGGHFIPPEAVVRRYWGGLRNLVDHYLPAADVVAIYDNSGDRPLLIADREPGAALLVHNVGRWQMIERARRAGIDSEKDA